MSLQPYAPIRSVLLRPEEYAEDEMTQLGNANGCHYVRKAGVENVHDGQIMVRLKSKRYIIIDYGYIPNRRDHELAAYHSHIVIPDGAGVTKCITEGCTRVGVPVLLYDSEPNEIASLYLRNGLCFNCQREVNEKRRTARKNPAKRKSNGELIKASDEAEGEVRTTRTAEAASGAKAATANRTIAAPKAIAATVAVPSVKAVTHVVATPKNTGIVVIRENGQDFPILHPDAIIINGPVGGTRPHGPDYRCHRIGSDLRCIVNDLSHETKALMENTVESHAAWSNPDPDAINQTFKKAIISASRATFLLTQWKQSFDAELREAEEANAMFADAQILSDAVRSGGMLMPALDPPSIGEYSAHENMSVFSFNMSTGIDMSASGFPWSTGRVSHSPDQLPRTPHMNDDDDHRAYDFDVEQIPV